MTRKDTARVATRAAKRRAEQLLRRIKRDPDAVIAQRRNDLLADLERVRRRTKRDRIVRETGPKT